MPTTIRVDEERVFPTLGIVAKAGDDSDITLDDNNDLTEGIAIEKIFAPHIPPVSSTKPFTGHALGAAGAVEAVISIMALTHGMVFPNLNFRTRVPELSFEPVKELTKTNKVRNVMSNSFGFGGNDSTLIFSAC